MSSEWEKFLAINNISFNFDRNFQEIKEFVRHNTDKNIVLISSGGTTVPLESRTVRFIDNFSVGTRGSASAEYFLAQGYAVIFLHRRGSLEPFKRQLSHANLIDILVEDSNDIKVCPEYAEKVKSILRKHKSAAVNQMLLMVEFTTLNDYLVLLNGAAQALNVHGKHSIFYLAAAVSDFYIPSDQMPEHKIQSSDGPLNISLHLVPKMLAPLVTEWAPNAFIVSFKLETNPEILIPKARQALERYKHQVVIGNILETRKKEVVLVARDNETFVRLKDEEMSSGLEIEERIVSELVTRHSAFIQT